MILDIETELRPYGRDSFVFTMSAKHLDQHCSGVRVNGWPVIIVSIGRECPRDRTVEVRARFKPQEPIYAML